MQCRVPPYHSAPESPRSWGFPAGLQRKQQLSGLEERWAKISDNLEATNGAKDNGKHANKAPRLTPEEMAGALYLLKENHVLDVVNVAVIARRGPAATGRAHASGHGSNTNAACSPESCDVTGGRPGRNAPLHRAAVGLLGCHETGLPGRQVRS